MRIFTLFLLLASAAFHSVADMHYTIDENRQYPVVVREWDDAGTIDNHYTYSPDSLPMSRHDKINDRVFYYLNDRIKITGVTDAQGNTVATYRYNAYGQVLGMDGPEARVEDFIIGGIQYDPSTGLYYARARHYDPHSGRFTQMDTWQGDAHQPMTQHKYIYGNSDPVNHTDPSGNISMMTVALSSGIGAGVGVGSVYASNFALGLDTSINDVLIAGLGGAVVGPVTVAVPAAGVALGVVGVGSSSWLLAKVFNNPDANYYQKTAAASLVAASLLGTRFAINYARSPGRVSVPKYPLQGSVQGVKLESTQPGLTPGKIGQIPGMMKTLLEGGSLPQIGGFKSGNRYVISEGNHRMAAALQLAKETGNQQYVTHLLAQGRWHPMQKNLKTYQIIRGE